MMNDFFTDPVIWIYSIDTLICFFGFVIFIWWWIRQKTASEVYAYITFLLLSVCVEKSIAIMARYLLFTDPNKGREMLHSFVWMFRTVPGTVIIAFIVYRMASRAYRTYRLEKRYKGVSEDDECREEFRDG